MVKDLELLLKKDLMFCMRRDVLERFAAVSDIDGIFTAVTDSSQASFFVFVVFASSIARSESAFPPIFHFVTDIFVLRFIWTFRNAVLRVFVQHCYAVKFTIRSANYTPNSLFPNLWNSCQKQSHGVLDGDSHGWHSSELRVRKR